MIERGHVHEMRPYRTAPLPNGGREVMLRCVAGSPAGSPLERGCGLEEERLFGADGEPTRLRFRFGGRWFEPLDLLRLAAPVEECPACHGQPMLAPCEECVGLGVVQDGARVALPDLHVPV